MNIYEKIHKIMEEVEYIQKEQPKDGVPYSHITHDSVTRKLRPKLVEHRIIVVPCVKDIEQKVTTAEGKDRYGNTKIATSIFTAATVEVDFVNIEDPKDRISVTMVGQGIDTQDKGIGKAISYAVKYAMLKLFNFETGDEEENRTEKNNFKGKLKFTPEVYEKVKEAINAGKLELAKVRLKKYDVPEEYQDEIDKMLNVASIK